MTAHPSFGTFAAGRHIRRWLLQLAVHHVLFGKIACRGPCSFNCFWLCRSLRSALRPQGPLFPLLRSFKGCYRRLSTQHTRLNFDSGCGIFTGVLTRKRELQKRRNEMQNNHVLPLLPPALSTIYLETSCRDVKWISLRCCRRVPECVTGFS